MQLPLAWSSGPAPEISETSTRRLPRSAPVWRRPEWTEEELLVSQRHLSLPIAWRGADCKGAGGGHTRASARPSRPLPSGLMELARPSLALAAQSCRDMGGEKAPVPLWLSGSGRADGVSRGTAAGIWQARFRCRK